MLELVVAVIIAASSVTGAAGGAPERAMPPCVDVAVPFVSIEGAKLFVAPGAVCWFEDGSSRFTYG